MKKLFSLILTLALSAGTMFASVKIGDLYYNLNDENKTAEVTSSCGDQYSGDIVIPSSVEYSAQNYSVVSIGKNAFQDSRLTAVTIPNSVTSIGAGAFSGCWGVSLTIPNSVVYIGRNAFVSCGATCWSAIEEIHYIGSMEEWCTKNCLRSLQSQLAVGLNWSEASVREGYVLYINDKKIVDLTIPNTITSLGDSTFANCSSLLSVVIPSNVNIGESTFMACKNLSSIKIEKGHSKYDSRDNCNAIIETATNKLIKGCATTVIPNSVTSIGELAFYNSSIATIKIPNSVTSIGDYAFRYCRSLTSIDLPNSVASVGEGAFDHCNSLTSLEIPNSVTNIGNYAFYYCDSLKSVVIGNGVTNIGRSIFEGCVLENIVLGASMKVIESNAFAYNYAKKESGYKDYDKPSIKTITCYSMRPPTVQWGNSERSFPENQPYSTIIYVPADYLTYYQMHDFWGMFDVRPIAAKGTETTTVTTNTTENSVDVTWPSVSGAATYELVIKDKDGKVICTLIFNSNGQLTSIAFNAPSRDDAPQKAQTAGFSFTITGLDAGTSYDLTITAKNEAGQELDKKNVSFHTESAEGIEDIHIDSDKPVKVLVDGQIYILRADHIFDTTGKMIR